MDMSTEQERDDMIEEVASFGGGWLEWEGYKYPTDEERMDALFKAVAAKYGRGWASSYCEGLIVSDFGPGSFRDPHGFVALDGKAEQ
jgi:hypothetical protein